MSLLHVVFRVGDSDYVLPASEVLQMESFTSATHVPGTAPHIVGVVQVRGRVIPVVDLRKRFGLVEAPHTLDSRVVVVQAGKRVVGPLADSAREVIRLTEGDFQPPPEVIAAQSRGFVQSIAQTGKRVMMRIDYEKVIGQEGDWEDGIHAEQA